MDIEYVKDYLKRKKLITDLSQVSFNEEESVLINKEESKETVFVLNFFLKTTNNTIEDKLELFKAKPNTDIFMVYIKDYAEIFLYQLNISSC